MEFKQVVGRRRSIRYYQRRQERRARQCQRRGHFTRRHGWWSAQGVRDHAADVHRRGHRGDAQGRRGSSDLPATHAVAEFCRQYALVGYTLAPAR